ncbi:Alpha/beta hydrolase domain-containing protein 17C [Camellia lanceoleosa]|uniref:Alpha/beta hydrolase domain-containing protein 17C n=1 Tax=Camellia lanceoleosa TaxID=1840588 RepID=A0ACC0F2V1_9ERIC|nr:Alpha/beta hydrolase domain-containing protein 17C [Camellia lanceoleosa]
MFYSKNQNVMLSSVEQSNDSLMFAFLEYDYSGYGQSSGKPSEHNTYADIEAVYKCLEESYGAQQENIILYGQSVGSGPTLDLAACLPHLRAIVLHSPILSGLKIMYPVKRTYWFDIYKVTLIFFRSSVYLYYYFD